MSNNNRKEETENTQLNVKMEIDSKTHEMSFWQRISYAEYFKRIENQIDTFIDKFKQN